MKPIIHRPIVLVLNRNWQAIHVKTPAQAFCMMATAAAMALDIEDDGSIWPVTWDAWLKLPLRGQHQSIQTSRGAVRIPTVVVAASYALIPLCRPRFGARGIWARDGGICQYTGRKLSAKEGNIDHIVPRSRGGGSTWQNCVLSHREINERKADRLPHEAGLRLLRKPTVPRAMPACVFIHNTHGIADWGRFLIDRKVVGTST